MTIDVEIQDEHGKVLARYDGPPLGLPFVRLASAQSACFKFIGSWGDATFNEAQTKVLLSELHEAATDTTDTARLGELTALIQFLECATAAHVYVKFIGD